MGRTTGQWFLGDLNCDGVVNVDDLAEVTAHLGDRVSAPIQALSGPAVQAAKAATAQKLKSSKVQKLKRSAKVVKRGQR